MEEKMNKIRELITERNITQKALADAVGVSEPGLSLIIRGKRDPGSLTAYRIAQFLGVTYEELFVKEGLK
jgi:transcriptional regulator with XRE-family HTH domain